MKRLFLKLRRRRNLERDLEAELAFHREMAAAGGNPIPLGNAAAIMEQSRDFWRFTFFENLWRDLVYGAYLYDFTTKHWWYTSSTLFPYLYDFTLNSWIFYFPDTKSEGHYTAGPRYFSNLTSGQIFTM